MVPPAGRAMARMMGPRGACWPTLLVLWGCEGCRERRCSPGGRLAASASTPKIATPKLQPASTSVA